MKRLTRLLVFAFLDFAYAFGICLAVFALITILFPKGI